MDGRITHPYMAQLAPSRMVQSHRRRSRLHNSQHAVSLSLYSGPRTVCSCSPPPAQPLCRPHRDHARPHLISSLPHPYVPPPPLIAPLDLACRPRSQTCRPFRHCSLRLSAAPSGRRRSCRAPVWSPATRRIPSPPCAPARAAGEATSARASSLRIRRPRTSDQLLVWWGSKGWQVSPCLRDSPQMEATYGEMDAAAQTHRIPIGGIPYRRSQQQRPASANSQPLSRAQTYSEYM